MENTLENKVKFFAQYWGQRVWMAHVNAPVNHIYMESIYETSMIELKPLTSITDEDAHEIAKIHGVSVGVFSDSQAEYLETLGVGKRLIDDFENGDIWELTFESVDFLRSRGYAIPYNGVSVEQQLEYGWIKLTS